jgi:hypothetical protein
MPMLVMGMLRFLHYPHAREAEKRSLKNRQKILRSSDRYSRYIVEIAIFRPERVSQVKSQSQNVDILGIALSDKLVSSFQLIFIFTRLMGINRK